MPVECVPEGSDGGMRAAVDRIGPRGGGGVQKRAAELLRIKPTTLNEMIKRYDIRPRRKKAASADAAGNDGSDELEVVGSDRD